MKLYKLSRSELCRIRNLLCQEICRLEHAKALDPKNPCVGITKKQAAKNAKMIGYDNTALTALGFDASAEIKKYRNGRFAKTIRYQNRMKKRREKRDAARESVGSLLMKAVVRVASDKMEMEWRPVK